MVAEDNKTPAKVYSLWVGTEVNNSQPATLTVNKIKLAEESLQVLQKQVLVLQVAQTSRFNLDGVPADEETPISRQPLDITEPKFVAIIIPGFGGGGTGAVPASSASSASSADSSSSAGSSSSASESSSSVSSSSESSSSSSSSSESSSSSSSAPDTTPPSISSFAVSECQQTLSSDGCLIATTTAFLSWASSSGDLDYYEFTNNGTISTTTATSTSLTLADNSNNSFSLRAKDLAGNWSTATTATAEVSLMPVVINEVAWAGNSTTYSADEWIELYNRTNLPVNLNNFILYSKTDSGPYLSLSGTVSSSGYYLIERSPDNATISDIAADLAVSFGNGLCLTSEKISPWFTNQPVQATTTIDEIPYDFNWYAGSDFSYYSMERYDPDIAGTSASNWGTNNALIINGKNAGGGNVYGTPKARNSLNYLINKGNGVYSSLTLSASGSPYFVNGVQSVTSSSTLTIEPGVVIKFNAINKSGLQFINGGKLSAVGSSANPIIFTSFYDDSYGGDTNGSIGSTSPAYGDWYGVRIDSPGTESTISRAFPLRRLVLFRRRLDGQQSQFVYRQFLG